MNEHTKIIEAFRRIGLEPAFGLNRKFYADKTGMQVIEDFILEQLTEAEKRGEEKARRELSDKLETMKTEDIMNMYWNENSLAQSIWADGYLKAIEALKQTQDTDIAQEE